MPEPVIADAVVAPGHDGRAELVVRVRYPNGAIGSVTLNVDQAQKLLDDCAVETAGELAGKPWKRLLDVMPGRALAK